MQLFKLKTDRIIHGQYRIDLRNHKKSISPVATHDDVIKGKHARVNQLVDHDQKRKSRDKINATSCNVYNNNTTNSI